MRKAKSAFMVGLGVFLMGMMGEMAPANAEQEERLVLSAEGRQSAQFECKTGQIIRIQSDSGVPNPAISGSRDFKLMCVGNNRDDVRTIRFEAVGGVFQLEDGGEGRTFIEVTYVKDSPKSVATVRHQRKPKK